MTLNERVRVEPLGNRFAIVVRHDSRETVLADYDRDVADGFAGYLRQAIAEAVSEERIRIRNGVVGIQGDAMFNAITQDYAGGWLEACTRVHDVVDGIQETQT